MWQLLLSQNKTRIQDVWGLNFPPLFLCQFNSAHLVFSQNSDFLNICSSCSYDLHVVKFLTAALHHLRFPALVHDTGSYCCHVKFWVHPRNRKSTKPAWTWFRSCTRYLKCHLSSSCSALWSICCSCCCRNHRELCRLTPDTLTCVWVTTSDQISLPALHANKPVCHWDRQDGLTQRNKLLHVLI